MLVVFLIFSDQALSLDEPQYWIWAGILPSDAPADTELLIYQGNFLGKDDGWNYEHKGIYPSPNNSKVQLVFRMHELPEPAFVSGTIHKYILNWRRHDVNIAGVQLDFDSPSAKLEIYAIFLRKVRGLLSNELEFSITGLGTWLADTGPETLKVLHASVDYVTYQLYVEREPLSHPERYIRFLMNNKYPYKIGMLAANAPVVDIQMLTKNTAFKGVSYFIQRE